MKYTTKKGREITIGDPERTLPEHLASASERIGTIASAAGSVAAVASLSRRGEKVSGRLGKGAARLGAAVTVIDAAINLHSAYKGLRNPDVDSGDGADTLDAGESKGELDTLRDEVMSGHSQKAD